MSRAFAVVLPGATLGVMGGGQLGRMFVHAAQRLGYNTCVLDPDAHSPAGLVSHEHICTAYDDAQGLRKLAAISAAITTEFENVPAAALQTLANSRPNGLPVSPSAAAVAIAQNRIEEKSHFVVSGVACAPYAVIETEQNLQAVPSDLLPGILKNARMGYDGKGQVCVKNLAELAQAWGFLKQVPCVLEKLLPLKAEFSVIVTAATTPWTLATCRSLTYRYMPWLACRCRSRASIHPPSCSTCWVTSGLALTARRARLTGWLCWLCPAYTCTCMARPMHGLAARWDI